MTTKDLSSDYRHVCVSEVIGGERPIQPTALPAEVSLVQA